MTVGQALEHARDPGADPALLVLARALEETLALLAVARAGRQRNPRRA